MLMCRFSAWRSIFSSFLIGPLPVDRQLYDLDPLDLFL